MALLAILALAVAGHADAGVPAGADRVTGLPTLGAVAQPQFAGYDSTTLTACADLACTDRPGLFYWLVGRDASYRAEPTVLWSKRRTRVEQLLWLPLGERPLRD